MKQIVKRYGKQLITALLEWQVKRLRQHQSFQIVAVVGSIGKTSTKLAIATVLQTAKTVVFQAGNYNDRLTVPLVLFRQAEPSIFNVGAWLKVLAQNERAIRHGLPFEIAVLELGTDGPGQIAQFSYLQPDLAVVTAVADEHMEYFGNLAAVAAEELAVCDFSKKVLVNSDMVDATYRTGRTVTLYGAVADATYRLVNTQPHGLQAQTVTLAVDQQTIQSEVSILGIQGAHVAIATFAVACEMGLDMATVAAALPTIQAVPGRMQILAGQQDTTIIDDTYNASPDAVKAALDVLYTAEASHRLAILGSMNELGETSAAAHAAVGAYCDPQQLDMVVTVGQEAMTYLAPAASQRGCQVKTFLSPYEAGTFVASQLQAGTVVLAKGSQNRIFCEEAVKILLADPADSRRLVRQTPFWLKQKHRQFGTVSAPEPVERDE